LVAKAGEALTKANEKFEALKETAVKAEAEDAAKPKQEFADKILDAGGSLLEGSDDFFSKAAKYAEGKYDAFSDKVSDVVSDAVDKLSNETKPTLELPKEEEPKA
jgi:ElaB/YqjD/DUF883 family membrane-anchored ribosome-binding protein